MSLNKALMEMFRAVREEAARNPEFAAKLGDAIAIYKPPKRKRKSVRPDPEPAFTPPPAKPFDLKESLARVEPAEPKDVADVVEAEAFAPKIALNPIAYFSREGEDALRQALADEPREALAALAADHNLDPAGAAAAADKAGLIDQIVAQAKKRVERDKALFNY